jgi:peroxiredoxin
MSGGDDCVSSLAVYRDTIADLDRKIAFLTSRRQHLADRLHQGAGRSFDTETLMSDYTALPANLPVPEDDGAANHLPGTRMPNLELTTSCGDPVNLGDLGASRTVVYLYPLTGQPGLDLPEGWDIIPGARGCSTEACDFRDHFADLREAGVQQVFGLSSQPANYQAEVVNRLHLPFKMISDEGFALGDALRLPTFSAEGHPRLYSRLTLVVRADVIEHVFYPIFPPNTHAREVLDWIRENPQPAP